MIEYKSSYTPISFLKARDWMMQRVQAIQSQHAPECVWFLEHEAFYARGSRAQDHEYHASLAPHSIPVYDVRRGGRYTYHGPGQRVIYLMLDLSTRERDLKRYIHHLELWVIHTLAALGIKAFTSPLGIGIWVICQKTQEQRKIAAIGVHVSKWVTSYGIALNVTTDLAPYQGITPCGIDGYGVTRLMDQNVSIDLPDLDALLREHFQKNPFLMR